MPAYADPEKNLNGPSNLAMLKPSLTSQPEWDAHFQPKLGTEVAPKGLALPPSPWAALQPKAQQAPSLTELASGGQNHQQAWTAGNRAPQSNQSPFQIPELLKRPDMNDEDEPDLYAWGSAHL